MSLLFGIVFLRQDYTSQGVMNMNGVLFYFLIMMHFQNSFSVINVSFPKCH